MVRSSSNEYQCEKKTMKEYNTTCWIGKALFWICCTKYYEITRYINWKPAQWWTNNLKESTPKEEINEKITSKMERKGNFKNIYHIDPGEGYTPKMENIPGYVWEYCEISLSEKSTLRHHLETLHAEHMNTCENEYNHIENMRTHVRRKHWGQVTTKKPPSVPSKRWAQSV